MCFLKITQEIFQSEHISAAICLRPTLLFITTIIIKTNLTIPIFFF